jgi:hypothetical protein
MVDQTNVNDAQFLNDWYRNNDVRQDLNTAREIGRNIMVDIYGITNAYIFAGLTVEDGAGADTFLVNAGRCRDYQKYHIVVPANVDNIPCVDNTGNWNYIAIQHIWAYANPDAAVKSGVAYNRQRSDYYEINVAAAAHNEAVGWVRLARARRVGAVWEYDMEFTEGIANYGRSREAELESWDIDFSYLGAVPAAPGILMDRHTIVGGPLAGPTGDLWRVPFDFLVCRVEVDARVAGVAAMDVDLIQNAVNHPSWAAGGVLVLAGAANNAIWYSPIGDVGGGVLVQYYKDDLIQVHLVPAGGAPTDITVLISGFKTGTV